MHTLLRLLWWLWRAWPVLVLLLLICIHLILIYCFFLDAGTTNKTISLFSQLIGGLLVLYSIDSNIGILRKRTLFDIFISYLNDFPLIKKSAIIEIEGAALAISGGRAKLITSRNPKNVEEKIEYLQEQLFEIK